MSSVSQGSDSISQRDLEVSGTLPSPITPRGKSILAVSPSSSASTPSRCTGYQPHPIISPLASSSRIIDPGSAPLLESPSTDAPSNTYDPDVDSSSLVVSVTTSPHLNPNWLQELKVNFHSLVVEKLSVKIKTAITENRKFSSSELREKRETRLSIINGIIDYIWGVFGGMGRPKLGQFREVVSVLAAHYPAMFLESQDKGYGLGGNRGLDGLANNLKDCFRSREGPRSAGVNKGSAAGGPSSAPKKGKRKLVYGESANRWRIKL